MQQALIRLTLKLTTSTCHDAENLDYYQTHQRQYAEYKKGLERQGKSIVEFLDKEFPEELPFHEDKRLPISEVKIKVLETSKENNKTFRFELWVTTEQSILIEVLPNGLLLAFGDCTRELQKFAQIGTFIYPYRDMAISTYQSFHTKQ